MTAKERKCVRSLLAWKRRDLRAGFCDDIRPSKACVSLLNATSALPRTTRFIIILLASPIIFLVWCLRIIYHGAVFILRYLFHYVSDYNFPSPGERNLQGIHHAFGSRIELGPKYYLACVNEWCKILYGRKDRIEEHMDARTLDYINSYGNHYLHINQTLRVALGAARERLSSHLGNYQE